TVAAAIHVPRVDTLEGFTPSLVTQLVARDGSVYATFARERRVMLKQNEIPPVMQQAVLASEDGNFFNHGGIDAMGVLRAAITDVKAGRVVEGASTITMQLARSLFLSRERTWRRKIEEAFVAVELVKNYSKPQILTLYLNLVNLGHGNYGVEAASRYYFDKPAAKLTLPEAAMLAGIIPAPSRYSPYRTPEQVKRNRDRVLRRMLEEKAIDQQQYQQAVAQPLLVATQQQEEMFAPYFSEDVRKYLEGKYGATTLYQGGLQVQTTLDPQIQKAAERAVREHLQWYDHRRGFRGPIAQLDAKDIAAQQLPTWSHGSKLVPERWYQGIVLESGPATAQVKISDQVLTLDSRGIAWTRSKAPSAILKPGMVAWFSLRVPAPPKAKDKAADSEEKPPAEPVLTLEQSINVPAVKMWDLVTGRRVIDFAQRCGIRSPLP
ncbi:MAG: transglycosylase domain-containing protein, partial [Acidobacteriota bacterium]